ncbi:MAG: hypothetical protein HOK55_00235 [Gammaproteobacteria bacterium]|jgi:hypothetical protein|nr:hypothetical protein [Gammaproteobacteria bacterium]
MSKYVLIKKAVKNFLKPRVMMTLILTSVMPFSGLYAYAQDNGNGNTKVDVCHVSGNSGVINITVSEPSVQAHLRHGDFLPIENNGSCESSSDKEACLADAAEYPANDIRWTTLDGGVTFFCQYPE